jgi:hypothetical protein
MTVRARLAVTRSEKDEERFADKAAAMLGFTVVRFSQPRASKQSPGIPDRLYLCPRRGRGFWGELKRVGGKATPQQRALHEALRACGHTVVVGPAQDQIAEMDRIVLNRPPDEGRG